MKTGIDLDALKRRRQGWTLPARATVYLLIALVAGTAPFMVYHYRSTAPAAGRIGGDGDTFSFNLTAQLPRTLEKTERHMLEAKIDSYLEHRRSPLAGLGHAFVDAQERTGVSAALLVGLLEAESTCATNGSLSSENRNGFGMKGPQPQLGIEARNGYCWWPDWESAINGAADFIDYYWGPAQSGAELKGYAAVGGPGSSWLRRVEGARNNVLGSQLASL